MIKLLTRQKFQQQNFTTSPISHPAKPKGTKQEHKRKPKSERRKKRHKEKKAGQKTRKREQAEGKPSARKGEEKCQKERQKSGRNYTIPQSLLVLAC